MKKAVFCVLFVLTAIFSITLIESYAAENVCFPEYKNKVIEIDISISEENFDKIKADPEAKATYEAGVTVDGKSFKKIGIRTRGSSSLKRAISLGKHRYPFELKLDEYDEGANFNSATSIKLNNCIGERVIAEYMAYEMYRSTGLLTPDCSLAFVKINGKDWGIYLAVETVNKKFIRRHFNGELNGSLYKSVSYSEGEEALDSQWFKRLETKYTKDNNSFLLNLQKSLDENDYASCVDVDKLLKYYAAAMASGDSDSFLYTTRNFYIYDNNGKAEFIPWDLDFSFEDFWYDWSIDGYVGENSYDSDSLFELVLSNDEYKEKYHEYLLEVTEKCLNKKYVRSTVSNLLNLLEPYFKRDVTAPDGTDDYWVNYKELCDNNVTQLTVQTNAETRYEQIKAMLGGELKSFYVPDEIQKIKEENLKNEKLKKTLSIIVPTGVVLVAVTTVTISIIIKKRKKEK